MPRFGCGHIPGVSRGQPSALFPCSGASPLGLGGSRGRFLGQPHFLLFLIFFFMASPTLKPCRQFTDGERESAAPSPEPTGGRPPAPVSAGPAATSPQPSLLRKNILEKMNSFSAKKMGTIFKRILALSHAAPLALRGSPPPPAPGSPAKEKARTLQRGTEAGCAGGQEPRLDRGRGRSLGRRGLWGLQGPCLSARLLQGSTSS